MKQVSEFTGRRARRGHVGLELEVEAVDNLPVVDAMGWTSKRDGSLRNYGMEYVTSSPIKVDEHKRKKLDYLVEQFKPFKVLKNCSRTSFHVHKNVSSQRPMQVWNQATTYWLFENLLTEYCGPNRKGNLFCLRLKDAEAVLKYALQDLRQEGLPFSKLRTDNIRYCGLNLNAIPKFGSIEFRSMRGTLDPEILDTWSTELYTMCEAASRFKDPSDIMDTYFGLDRSQFLSKFFSPKFVETLKSFKNWDDLVDENSGILCELAYFHDWSKWEKRINLQDTTKLAKQEEEDFLAVDEDLVQDDFARRAARAERDRFIQAQINRIPPARPQWAMPEAVQAQPVPHPAVQANNDFRFDNGAIFIDEGQG